MRSPPSSITHSWKLPRREKPQFLHVAVGAGVAAFSYYLLLQSSQQFLAEATAKLLSLSGIGVEKLSGSESPLLVLKLMNGSALNLALTWQRSGLLSIIIFGLLFVFLVFPLESPLWLKVAWLEFGSLAGLAWSFIRLSTMALIIYHFGANTEALVNFATSPVVDFVWVIPVWSLGLSMMVSAKRKNVEQKTGEI